jgi:hypothetical protein
MIIVRILHMEYMITVKPIQKRVHNVLNLDRKALLSLSRLDVKLISFISTLKPQKIFTYDIVPLKF